MKQGNLKAAIRDRKGNPCVEWTLPDGRVERVMAMKTPLLELLDKSFEHKNIETGLILTEDGLLTSEAKTKVALGPATVSFATAEGEPLGKPSTSPGMTLTVVCDTLSLDSVANSLDLGTATPGPAFTLDFGDTPGPVRAPFTLDL